MSLLSLQKSAAFQLTNSASDAPKRHFWNMTIGSIMTVLATSGCSCTALRETISCTDCFFCFNLSFFSAEYSSEVCIYIYSVRIAPLSDRHIAAFTFCDSLLPFSAIQFSLHFFRCWHIHSSFRIFSSGTILAFFFAQRKGWVWLALTFI